MITYCLSLINLNAQDAKVLLLNNKSDETNVTNYLTIYEDKSGSLSIDNIKSKNNEFTAYNKSQKLNKESFYWGRINIKKISKISIPKIITIGKKRHSDISSMYLFNENILLKESKSGHFVKSNEKEVKQELGSKFFINLKANNNYTLYFRIKNISGFRPNFYITIQNQSIFYTKLSQRNITYGLILGILSIMFLYNILIFFFNRQYIYIFYSLYVFGLILNIIAERGLLIEFFIHQNPILNPFIFILSTGVALSSYLQFIRLFLDTKKLYLKWDKLFVLLIITYVLVTIALLIILSIQFNVFIAINASNILNFFVLIIATIFMVYLFPKRNYINLFFISGTVLLTTGTILQLVLLLNKINIGINPQLFLNIGAIGQIILFSLGLSYKMKLVEIDRNNLNVKLIKQLKHNEELNKKVNIELENKVKERTTEIQLQKDKISSYAENLKEKNVLLIENNEEIKQHREEIQVTVESLMDANEEISKQKIILEQTNKDITDSISSAKRIQTAMLPSIGIIKKYFNDYMILYMPRDIVSGDFYWTRKINDLVILAVADCTGHGVPGAFLSMLGISFLNDIVSKSKIIEANLILESLRKMVKTSLNQEGSKVKVSEGMDISLCIINTKTNKLYYSGANNPIYIIKENNSVTQKEFSILKTDSKMKIFNSECENQIIESKQNCLLEIKPTRNPIGMYVKEKPFEAHEVQLNSGDKLYMFSDGYVDQISDTKKGKFNSKRLKQLLLTINSKNMSSQKAILSSEFDNWRSSIKQIDDILIIGVKIK